MCRILELASSLSLFRLFGCVALIFVIQGCATTKVVPDVQPVIVQKPLAEHIESHEFTVANGDDVIGQLGAVRLERGDTLPDIARHFGLGLTEIHAANPGVDTWLPEPGERIILPLSFILPDVPRNGIVINLSTMRLFQYKNNGNPLSVVTYPVGVGAVDRPSPLGRMLIDRKASQPTWHVPASIAKSHLKKGDPLPATVPPGPQNPLGEYALYLSKPSYLIHGTNKPASIGLRATNGCIRLYPEDIKKLFENTLLKTPVTIVDQPYLVGQGNGMLFLEVHGAPDDIDVAEFDKMYAKLKSYERKLGRSLDWNSVTKALAEVRGIPEPIFEISQGAAKRVAEPIELKHPEKFFAQPELPEMKSNAWTIVAAEMPSEKDAIRLAAIINHLGPHIPARVVPTGAGYQIIAGPFTSHKEAQDVIRRLRIELELDGVLVEPTRTQ